ncbi:phosphoserine aminotransferase [Carnobacterium sp. 17-4]|uniref:3-phosphoserine/phosphohydroxythreonine transaminase n=1 Tax=Carnobacterium sp. (strain 17-4) TaxID=208596 RepID=UPI0002059046|nr:3-phosphoserine/phosphohydroxythreonine transaminase [Carnobacterium sp. 17-4]AEB29127.1 phosphoserine aminotransferase [Carnobacterium sp. 17-4]
MERVYNFSAGPAIMPVSVLKTIQEDLLSYQGSGMSVMELSHRSSLFQSIMNDAESLLRELMTIPSNYKVLFLQGGASLQFTMLPMNLGKTKVAYVNTGSWSEKAIEEAQEVDGLTVEVIASSKENSFTENPEIPLVDKEYDYVHITTNNTIEGTAFLNIPASGEVPLVADMSSNILSSSYNVSDFGLIYAGAQKNIGPAGVTVVIVREDLIGLKENLPAMLDYKILADNGSMYNTPPTFAIYAAKLMFEWLKELGGVAEIEKINRKKAAILYEAIDSSKLFRSPVSKISRSLTNIPFVTGNAELDKLFIKQAESQGMINLKGHRSVGGMRASLYNAFPIEGVIELVALMKEFETKVEGE